MSACKVGCDKKNCDGSCKDKFTSRKRQAELEACDAWRCGCGTTCSVTSSSCSTCQTSRALGECVKFGMNANASRKADDVSPADVALISNYYEDETVVLLPDTGWLPYPGQPTWFYIALGNIKVSHDFCVVTMPTGITEDDATPVTPILWAVAGSEIACGDSLWVWVMNHPTKARTPLPPNIIPGGGSTGIVCDPCPPPPCAAVPANGPEIIMVQLAAPLGVGESLVGGTIHITRCNWLQQVNANVQPINGRLRIVPVPPTRVTPGSVSPF